jgi:hypothetical protein
MLEGSYQLLPVTVAHHMTILTISFSIVINIQIIGKYYLIVLTGYLKNKKKTTTENKYFWRCVLVL